MVVDSGQPLARPSDTPLPQGRRGAGGEGPLTVRREELARLEPEWRELLARCPAAPVFLSPVWLKTWWQEFGADKELVLLSVRDDGELVGVAPLMRSGGQMAFAGDTEVCDYMDFACAGGCQPALLTAVLRSLSEEPWQELSLWAMREDSPALAALPAACAEMGLQLQVEPEDVCPQLSLPGSWEEYLAGLDRKDRHELRRELRRLPQAGEPELEVLAAPPDVVAALDDFLRLHTASRAEKAAFMTEQMARFFRRLVSALAEEGLVEMTFLKLGGKRVAAVLCFRGDRQTLLYNSGYDPEYAGFSVGLLSKALALQRAIGLGHKRFDFLRGAEPYKYDLGARDLAVYRCIIRRGRVDV